MAGKADMRGVRSYAGEQVFRVVETQLCHRETKSTQGGPQHRLGTGVVGRDGRAAQQRLGEF